MHVVLDVTRLLLSVHRPSPSGIDRVEMAYARHWLARPARDGTFVVQSPWGWFGAVPRDRVAGLVEALAALWAGGKAAGEAAARAWRLAAALQARLAAGIGRIALRQALATQRRSVFLLVSHRALDRTGPIAALRRAGAGFVPFIHDLIPLTHPEYARPRQILRHEQRVATTAALADGVIANSAATAEALARRLPLSAARGRAMPIAVAPLGIEEGSGTFLAGPAPAGTPYFLCLGTIEPRKNHLLLLHLWRSFAAQQGAAPGAPPLPRLVIVGRRGWENENILDLLDRCTALQGLVAEAGTLPDREVAPLLAGARALLFPSFAEGYGLPLAEALAHGLPAICSDLPALREVGGAVPDYIDPLDGPAWRDAILDYARPASRARTAQCGRLAAWQPPRWEAHFARVEALLERAVRPALPAALVPGFRPAATATPVEAASA